jgi:hypothetical protein
MPVARLTPATADSMPTMPIDSTVVPAIHGSLVLPSCFNTLAKE